MRHLALISRSLLVLLAVAFHPLQAAGAVDPYAPVLPALRDTVRSETDGRLSSYALDLTLDPAASTLAGTERVVYVNTTGQAQRAIPFRLYPNAPYYGDGELAVQRVRVDGLLVEPELSASDTVMTVPLARPLEPGERVRIAIRFVVAVPVDSAGTFGIFNRDSRSGTWALADWYPVLAGWEPDAGWRLDAPSALGDPTFSETGLYDLTLTVPERWSVVATGDEQIVSADGASSTWQITSGPARELTLVIDDDFRSIEQQIEGTTVTVYTDGDGGAGAGGDLALAAAVASLATFSELFGPYPYDRLDLVETELAGALGVSWSGLVFLDAGQLLRSESTVADAPERVRFTVAHEVGHQWVGGLVGVNSNDHAFLVEGLTNYLTVAATEREEGRAAGRQQFQLQCVDPYLRALERDEDGIADQPIAGDLPPSFGTLIYGKAAVGFHAIRLAMGDDAFFGAIADWTAGSAFAISGPEALLAAFESAAPDPAEVARLWRFWFQEAGATAADVEALL